MFQDLWHHGKLEGNTREFKMDFDAIYKGIDEGKAPEDNNGSDFEVEPDAVQLSQWEYTSHIRVLLLDKDNNVIGATVSDNFANYGKPRVVAHAIEVADINPYPYLKTITPFTPNAASKEFPTGIAILASGKTNWGFSVNGIPMYTSGNNSWGPKMVEYQVSTVPFSIQEQLNSDDYMNPAGLVYKVKEPKLYITKDLGFNIPFAEFAPSEKELGKGKVVYYVRSVVYYPGTRDKIYTTKEINDGMWDETSFVAIATKGDIVVYTGDYSLYESINNGAATVGVPEEVVVKSNVPQTRIVGYDPPRGYVSKPEEYFEVTRRIMSDEYGFYITNTATGEQLNPYSWHEKKGMTKAEHQKKLDQMLPVGAEIHVKPKTKNWFEQVIGDFIKILESIYKSVQNAYNGLKAKLINTFAEGLGKVFGGKTFFEKAFTYLADYGLMTIGLPPSLPNSDILAFDSIDYLVRVAMAEAAKSTGVPIDGLPDDIRKQVVSEVQNQFKNMRTGDQNPFGAGYLRYSVSATQGRPVVYIEIYNDTKVNSPAGTLYVCVRGSVCNAWQSESVYVPSLKPGELLYIPIYLAGGSMSDYAYQKYKNNEKPFVDQSPLSLDVSVDYNVPDIVEEAKKQGAKGTDPNRPDKYVWDKTPSYYYTKKPFNMMKKQWKYDF